MSLTATFCLDMATVISLVSTLGKGWANLS